MNRQGLGNLTEAVQRDQPFGFALREDPETAYISSSPELVGDSFVEWNPSSLSLRILYANAPLPTSPAGDITTTTPRLNWIGDLSGLINCKYHVQIATDNGFQNVVWEQSNLTGTFYDVPSAAWLESGVPYYWRVFAENPAAEGGYIAYEQSSWMQFTPHTVHRISGYIVGADGQRFSGITVSTSDVNISSTTTDSTGYYFLYVPYLWSGTVTPDTSGVIKKFSPTSKSYSAVSADQRQDFTPLLSIEGYVTHGGSGLSGITVSADNGGDTYTTSGDGKYKVWVPSGWTGRVTPSRSGYSFDPTNRSYTKLTASVTNQNFTRAVTISGKLATSNSTAIAGATVKANTGQTTVSDAGGNYALVVPYQWTGTVTPTISGWSFTPLSKTYSSQLTSNQTSQNYTGTGTAIVCNTNPIIVLENGYAYLQVRLTTAPSSNIVVTTTWVSGDTSITVYAGSSLIFTSSNWITYQQVTFRAEEDTDFSDDSTTFECKTTTSGWTPVRVIATEDDNDKEILTDVSSLTVPEGQQASFQVRLNAPPTSELAVDVYRESGDMNLSIVQGSRLYFTASNYNLWQTVSLAAAEDADGTNGNATILCSMGSATWREKRVTATEADNDGNFILTPTAVSVGEGNSATFGVHLSCQPQSNVPVTVNRIAGDGDLLISGGASLLFTPGNWSADQVVNLAAGEDADGIDGTATFRCSSPGWKNTDLLATEADNDRTVVTNTDTLSVPENGSAAFQVRLGARPAGDVPVTVSLSGGDADLTVQPPTTLTFTPATWDVFQTVTLNAANDADQTNGTATIDCAASGWSTKSVTAEELDDDVIRPNPPTGLTTDADDRQVSLSWTAPTQNTDGSTLTDLAGYNVYYGTTSGQTLTKANTSGLVAVTSYTVTGLTNDTTYYFTVTAVNSANPAVESRWSDERAAVPMAPTLVLLSPNGGEKWEQGSAHDLTWTSRGKVGNNVILDLYKGGSSQQTLVASTPNDGSFTWTIPATFPVGDGYTVRVTSLSAPTATDQSDANFEILPAPLTGDVYVDKNAAGTTQDGKSWVTAYTELAPVLNAVTAGTTIHVAKGTYKPTMGSDRAATFQLKNGVTLSGGYPTGGGTRNPAANVTTLSGDLLGNDNSNVSYDEPTRSENSYHVVTGSGTDGTAVLDGLTIAGGNARVNYTEWDGGGMYNNGGSPTLTNVNFSSNSAYRGGGGMYNVYSSSPTLTSVNFSGNTAYMYGGGIFNSHYSSPTLTNATFSANYGNEGGGINNYESSNPTLTNVTFSGNVAYFAGGMSNLRSSPTLMNVTFSSNTAYEYGGGMTNEEAGSTMLTNVNFMGNSADYGGGMMGSGTLTNVTFTNYSATGEGGGMDGTGTLTNVTFTSNSAGYSGGGMRGGGTLRNVTFSGNSAGCFGGGMDNDGGSTTLTNVTFSGNTAENDGGGMYNRSVSPTLTNVTFSNNTADSEGGGIFIKWGSPSVCNTILWGNTAPTGAQIYADTNTATVSHSVVQGTSVYPGTGNTNADPKFGLLGNYGGYTQTIPILAGSSAINAGTTTGAPATDQRWCTRDAQPDIGAYEYGGSLPEIDVQGNGVSIADGDTTPSAADQTDFGLLAVPGGARDRTFTIRNTGAGLLVLFGTPKVVISGPNASDFTVLAIPADTIPANGTTTFTVRFAPTATGVRTATVTLINNDADEAPYDFSIQGTGTAMPSGNLYVDQKCSGSDHDGMSWATAFLDLAPVLQASRSGNTIHVAKGTYKPTNGTERTATFQLKNGVTLLGGYPTGGGTRNPAANVTTLSGDLLGNDNANVSYDEPTRSENSYHVVTGNATDGTAVLDGFTVTEGNANDRYGYAQTGGDSGGGMYNEDGSPTLTNVTFSRNSADSMGGGMLVRGGSPTFVNVTFSSNSVNGDYGGGGGMYNGQSTPTLTNVAFSGNAATYGGGMLNDNSNPTLTNVAFSGNSASGIDGAGGGMYNSQSTPTLTNVTFSGNIANSIGYGSGGGGGMANYSSSPSLTNVTFNSNSANVTWIGGGGGIYNVDNSSPTLTNVTFTGNSANDVSEGSGGGGGIFDYWDGSSTTLTNVTFSGNSATGEGCTGGGMMGSGTLSNVTFSGNAASYGGGGISGGGTLTNVTFTNNSATIGGGMLSTSNSTLTNVTFSGNTASYDGGGMYNKNVNPTVRNTILWGNTPDQIYNDETAAIVTDSIVQGGYAGGTNIIQDDPKLGTLGNYGGYTQTIPLLAVSSAIDKANANAPATDQRGYARVGAPDIGAYEYGATPPPAPEVDVQGNNVSIVDGDTTPTATDHTDFGSADIAAGALDRTFTIKNTGNANLSLTGTPKVSVSGTNASDFSVTQQPSSPVSASASTTFTVRFDPSASGTRTATLTIANNDSDEDPYNFAIQGTGITLPSLSINDVTKNEGNAGTTAFGFTVSLSSVSSQSVSVSYTTSDGTATTADSDYVAATGTLTFTPGTTSQPVTITVNGDAKDEDNETFTVTLSNPVKATINDGSGLGTITNDDTATAPTVSINDITKNEGNAGTTAFGFTVSLSAVSGKSVSVSYTTSDGTATTADSDYVAASGTMTFSPGTTSQPVTVTVNGDTKDEDHETFNVNLSNQINATILDGSGLGTITNDDTPPTLSINDVTKNEGNAGTTGFGFTVSLSAVSGKSVSVSYTTSNGTATTADSDYIASSGTVNFAPGTISQPVTVTVNGDTKDEDNEMFNVTLSHEVNATILDGSGQGTITNDDTPPDVSVNDVTRNEGNSGTTSFGFTVTLSAVSGKSASVSYTTSNGTGTTADSDYIASSGTLNFAPGTTSQPVTVTVNGDTKDEDNETFNVTLSNQVNATILDGSGVGTISDDDSPPSLSINDVSVTEGNSGSTNATFTLTVSAASGKTVTVDYATADGTATVTNSDYTAANGTVTINSGAVTQTVTVAVSGDTTFESDETFTVNLSSPSNATIADGTGQCTLRNDDTPPIQADLMVKNSTEPDSAYGIDNQYQTTPSGDQIEAQTVPASTKVTYNVRIQNDGGSTRTFLLKATESSGTGWTVAYKNGATLITTAIKGTGFNTPNLAPGNTLTITVEMTPAGTVAENAQKSATINAFNDKADTTVRDSVRATTTKRTITQPDALIKKSTEADSALAINDLYQTTPSGDQIEAQTVAKGGKATYSVRIQNDGNTTRTFVVKATETTTTGWTVTYKVGTLNVTTAIKGTGRTTASLKPGFFETIVVDMTAGSTLANGSSKSTTLKVFLTSSDKTVRDTVQATTTVGTSSSIYRNESDTTAPEIRWVEAPPSTMAAGMNYGVKWQVVGGKAVTHTYVVMSTDPEPTKKPVAMTEIQSGKPGVFRDWVPAPSKGHLYYQAVAIVDGKSYLSEVVYGG